MKLSIVVPFRDREAHLSEFRPHMQKFLETSGIDYRIVIVEQSFEKPFNRAKLLNVGFDLTRDSDYFCFHDVDMLPLEADYSYCSNPTHLAARAEQFGWKLPYDQYFGGVTMFDRESFLRINGYSNLYFGWGAEDDDVFLRCQMRNMKLSRKNCSFRSLSHERNIDSNLYGTNIELLRLAASRMTTDGLNSLEYQKIEEQQEEKYMRVKVDI